MSDELPIGPEVRPVVLDDRSEIEALGVRVLSDREAQGSIVREARIVARSDRFFVARVVLEHGNSVRPSTRAIIAAETANGWRSFTIRSKDLSTLIDGASEIRRWLDVVRRG